MTTLIGIMQGRLVPPVGGRIQCFPRERWEEEFPRAQAAGLSPIEWIYDAEGEDTNPIATSDGRARLRQLAEKHGIQVRSFCADWFMEHPLVRASPRDLAGRRARLDWLIDRAGEMGVRRIVIPFVDASAIETEAEAETVIEVLGRATPAARSRGVELHLETGLAPAPFARLLDRLSADVVKVNYDSGNSASLGYHPRDEFAAYGSRVGSVHIKDRVEGGGTVPLGTGDTDFDGLFAALRARRYDGDFILQVARGTSGDEVAWARANRAFVDARWP